ncbi:hypothetical protein FOZ62_032324, partial [Perkinsus olseni]
PSDQTPSGNSKSAFVSGDIRALGREGQIATPESDVEVGTGTMSKDESQFVQSIEVDKTVKACCDLTERARRQGLDVVAEIGKDALSLGHSHFNYFCCELGRVRELS